MERGLFRRIEYFVKGDAMDQKSLTQVLFFLIVVLILANIYTMYQLNLAIELITVLGDNLRK